jgi:hypothetical protein
MKKVIIILISVFVLNCASYAQFKRPEDGNKINRNTNNLILGIFNPKNFTMNHSFQVSMLSSGFGNVSVTSYVNSMNYKVTDRLNISADVKLQYAPYVSSSLGGAFTKGLQNDLNGLSLSRVSLDYKVSDNSFIKLEYRKLDDMYLYNHFNDYSYDRMYR